MVKQQQLRSTVDSQAPLPGDLADGELALNINENSPAIYLKDTAGNVRKIAGSGTNPTDLGNTPTASSVRVTSSTGANTTIPAATATLAGVQSAADKSRLDGIEAGAQVNDPTNLSNTPAANSVEVTSSTGTNTTLPAATATLAGVQTAADKTKLDGIQAGAEVNDRTNLDNTPAADSVEVSSSTGSNTTLPAATTTLAGVQTAADKTKLNGIEVGAEVNESTNLSNTPAADSVEVSSSTGSNTTIPAATSTLAGVQTASDKSKLDGIEAGAEANDPTNLGNIPAARSVVVSSSTGSNTTLPAATTSLAGVQTAADKTKLDGIEAGAEVNDPTNLTNTPAADSVEVSSSTGTNTTLPAATTSLAGVQSAADKSKLNGIAAGAEVNVQSDWSQTTTSADDFIKNKPTIPAAANNGQINVNAGTGLSASGSNATANQSGNTTRTISLNASLNNLNNCTVPSPASGELLSYNGSAWVNVDEVDAGTY